MNNQYDKLGPQEQKAHIIGYAPSYKTYRVQLENGRIITVFSPTARLTNSIPVFLIILIILPQGSPAIPQEDSIDSDTSEENTQHLQELDNQLLGEQQAIVTKHNLGDTTVVRGLVKLQQAQK